MTTTEPTRNDRGDEEHPSFGVVRVFRQTSHPAQHLFDSSIPHTEYVHLEIARATRRRDLHNDRIHGSTSTLVEINMSLSQWGAMVSSFGQGSGTPVTLHRVGGERMPAAAHESRLAETAREVADQTRKSTEELKQAVDAVLAAFQERKGVRDMTPLMNTLRHTLGNLPSNMKFAADQLTRHAEDVVSKAKADIEAARQFGSQLEPAASILEIETPDVCDECEQRQDDPHYSYHEAWCSQSPALKAK